MRERVISKGYSEAELNACIELYTNDDIWMVVANGAKLRFMNAGVNDDDQEM